MPPDESEFCSWWDGTHCLLSQPIRTRNLAAPRGDLKTSSIPTAMTTLWDRRPPPVQTRTTLISRSSQIQQRHLEYLATSLRTLDKDWGSHCSSGSDEKEEPSRDLAKSRHRKCAREVQEVHPQMQWDAARSSTKEQRPRRRSPDTGRIWISAMDGR